MYNFKTAGNSSLGINKIFYWIFSEMNYFAYSPSYNLTPPISRVLIGKDLIFCSLTSTMCCNSPWKYTPVKYKKRQKSGFPTVTQTTSLLQYKQVLAFCKILHIKYVLPTELRSNIQLSLEIKKPIKSFCFTKL